MGIDTELPLPFEDDGWVFITATCAAVVVGGAPVADGAIAAVVVVGGVDTGALGVAVVRDDAAATWGVVCKGTVVVTEATGWFAFRLRHVMAPTIPSRIAVPALTTEAVIVSELPVFEDSFVCGGGSGLS